MEPWKQRGEPIVDSTERSVAVTSFSEPGTALGAGHVGPAVAHWDHTLGTYFPCQEEIAQRLPMDSAVV